MSTNSTPGRVLLDPTSDRLPAMRARVARLPSLLGKTVGLLDISKPRGNVFLDRLEALLRARGVATIRFAKPTFTKPAPIDLCHEIATRCDALIEALAVCGSCTSCSVHDIVDLETRGIPSVFVATTVFLDGAERQAKALGFDPAAVYVSHPVQDRTDEEMCAMADEALAKLVASLETGS
jgi:hypothetical protein